MNPTPAMLKNPIHLLSLGFGAGLSPGAPGTVGTLVAVGIYVLLPPLSWAVYLVGLVAAFALGVWLCEQTTRQLGVDDHGGIVWDEFVGYWMTMFMAPAGWQWVVGGFVLFRFLDILKPWPIKWADSQVKGGFGIMLDDAIAGIMGALCIQAVALLVASG